MAALRNVTPGLENSDPAAIERAYRKALWTIIGHAIFFIVCVVIAVVARRMFKMPPALLTVAFFAAMILFGGDFWRFLTCRRRLRRLREQELN
jgi:hypothetical protein